MIGHRPKTKYYYRVAKRNYSVRYIRSRHTDRRRMERTGKEGFIYNGRSKEKRIWEDTRYEKDRCIYLHRNLHRNLKYIYIIIKYVLLRITEGNMELEFSNNIISILHPSILEQPASLRGNLLLPDLNCLLTFDF